MRWTVHCALCSRAGHFRYFFIFLIIKNDFFAFVIKLITNFCTSPISENISKYRNSPALLCSTAGKGGGVGQKERKREREKERGREEGRLIYSFSPCIR